MQPQYMSVIQTFFVVELNNFKTLKPPGLEACAFNPVTGQIKTGVSL